MSTDEVKTAAMQIVVPEVIDKSDHDHGDKADYLLALDPACPSHSVTVGGYSFEKFTTPPTILPDGKWDNDVRRYDTGHVVRLTEAQRDRIVESLNREVVIDEARDLIQGSAIRTEDPKTGHAKWEPIAKWVKFTRIVEEGLGVQGVTVTQVADARKLTDEVMAIQFELISTKVMDDRKALVATLTAKQEALAEINSLLYAGVS